MAVDPYLPYVSRVPLSWADSEGPAGHWAEGTLLFVDVAGFTALSERLSVLGRAGAEELTDLLDGAFARLLAAAYEDGGSLLSFGGDALLLFFHGPDHQRRAAHAAGVIKKKPAELGALETSVGPVRLRLSMGAHSGRFLFAVAGEDSRVVLLLGPDATATVRLEQRATAGQVYLGHSLAAAVPECAGPVDDLGALLTRTPRPPVVGDPAPPGDPLTPPSRFLSPALREHIAGHPSSEHRRVAVGFVQMKGTDALLAADPTRLLEAVDEIVVTTQRAAAEYGVTLVATDVDADGAKLILVAGAPRATEHEEERLLRACRAVVDLDSPLALRSGVTSGHVFVGDVGPSYRRAYTVMGDRVNLAARLMASADPGELRTLPEVLAKSSTTFETTELEPLRLKGIAQPVPAVAVGAPVGQSRGRGGGTLFGREAELGALREALERAGTGQGGALEVVGEPGFGKTALLAELLAHADRPTLRAAAAPYEKETPYGLAKRVLRHLLAVDAEASAEDVGRRAATALGALDPSDLALVLVAADAVLPGVPEVVQDELFPMRLGRAVLRSLEVLVPGPALLVVEDLQWADPSSLALLRNVADHLVDHPWLLVGSHRPDGPPRSLLSKAAPVVLGPLTPEASDDLVHALTESSPMAPQRIAALIARSGGNPMFLTELVRTSREGEDLPDSVEAVVSARLDALPAYLRKLLRQASVLGATFDLDLLGDVAGFVPDRGEWKLLAGLLERQGSRGTFLSEMYRDVAYATLLFKERRSLHRVAVEVLSERGSTDAELLALHAAEARDHELTWRYAVIAGQRAAARSAHDTAVTAYRRALHAHDQGALGAAAETFAVHVALGESLVRAGRAAEALPVYRRARALSPAGPDDPKLCHLEALARIELGQHAAALRWLARGLKAAKDDATTAVRLGLLESQAGVQYRMAKYASSLKTLRSILEQTRGSAHETSYAHAYDLTHLVYTTTGDPRRADFRSEAVRIFERLGDNQGLARALNNLGNDAYYEGRWPEAIELLDRARQCDVADANDVGAAIGDTNISEMLVDQGYYDDAHLRLQRALRTFLADDFALGCAEVLLHLGRLELRRSRYAEAVEHLTRCREYVESTGADSMLPDVLVREAELEVLRGRMDVAEARLEALARHPDVRAEMSLIAGRLHAAVAARRGEDDKAESLLRETIAQSDSSAPLSAALARHSLAVVLARRGDDESELLRHSALETLRHLGVMQFRDPLAGDDLVVISLPKQIVDLTQRRGEREAAAV